MISTHAYTAVVKRPGRSDAVLSIRAGRIVLDATSAPHVTAELEVAVPKHWTPVEPHPGGYWQETGAEQFDFFNEDGAPPFQISEPDRIWIETPPTWYNEPVEDPPPVEVEEEEPIDFFGDGAPDFHIMRGEIPEDPGPPVKADLRDIDPRDKPRIVITVDRDGAQHREFDLVLRDRTVSQEGVITLSLASDESLLTDWAPLADDPTPLLLESLRDVVNYVLDTAIGAELDDSDDAVMIPRWSARNRLTNPNARFNVDGWSAGAGMSAPVWDSGAGVGNEPGFVRVNQTAATGNLRVSADLLDEYPDATAGRSHVLIAHVRSPHTMDVRLTVQYRNAAGIILTNVSGPWAPVYSTWEYRVFIAPPAPAGTVKATPIIEWRNSTSGNILNVDRALFDEGEFDPGYFDGSTPTTSTYAYAWAEDANASPSTRTLLVDAPEPDAFAWRAGINALEFLHPLVQAAGLRLVCDEQRVWRLRTEQWTRVGKIRVAYAENMIAGSDTISRDDDSWYDAAVTRYTWTSQGVQQERTDVYALNTPHSRVRVFDKQAPYPGPGFSEYAVRRAQGRGRTVEATAVADWDASADMAADVILAGALPQFGRIDTVTFDLDRDEMTITTRTDEAESTP